MPFIADEFEIFFREQRAIGGSGAAKFHAREIINAEAGASSGFEYFEN
jgi:hypothetical protein